MRIKKENEWNAAFSMPEGSFEPIVMFFGLTNLLATFQVMMNDLLRDLVVEKKIVVFIDDVIIATETEEGHNKIVEIVLRRLEKNDLFVKPEKCVWKVKEVGFLGVIIGEDRVRIEKEKVAVFIDDVMIVIETEEGHDEIVEEILRRLEENNLFVKPEKYV